MPQEPQPNQTEATKAPFCVSYAPASERQTLLARSDVLAVIDFDVQAKRDPNDPRAFCVGLEQIGPSPLLEVWHAPGPIHCGQDNCIGYARTDEVVLAHMLLDESQYAGLAQATEYAYQEILRFTQAQGFPKLLRVWNYFPQINTDVKQLERYRAFSVGRHQALKDTLSPAQELPAASALGTYTSGLQIYFLAAKESGVQIENPRQVSAFEYPLDYGPRRPLFSRATFKRWQDTHHFYISGTASIVGHESRHADEVFHQLDETLNNIDALIENANALQGLDIHSASQLSLLKIYIRTSTDVKAVHAHISARLGREVPCLYLQGDICRADLLIEIESLYTGNCGT